MPSKAWNEIIYPFPNFNGTAIEVWEWINDFIPHFIMDEITNPWWVSVQLRRQYAVSDSCSYSELIHSSHPWQPFKASVAIIDAFAGEILTTESF